MTTTESESCSTGDLPRQVGVYGGGRMGGGIAHAFVVGGCEVIVVESHDDAAASARTRIDADLRAAKARGVSVRGRFRVVVDPAALASCRLVVEAVPEDVDLKRSVLARIAGTAPEADIASNTSSLSIDHLANAVPDPARVVGLHFFNPVPVSALVEIVVGAHTAPDLVAQARRWVAALGKTAITVHDSPGFASSRLGVVVALEAMRMLEEGVASAPDIDAAMRLGYGHPMGPLRTTDVVGLDVRLAIAQHLEAELGPRFTPPNILLERVAAGELGRKTGRGFFDW